MSELRVVFDCVVFVQALASPHGPAGQCWDQAGYGRISLFVSSETLAELGEVLARPRLAKRLGITAQASLLFLSEVRRRAILVADVLPQITFPRDPKDEPYINLALACDASFLVTRDNDLLDLMKPDSDEGARFRTDFPKLQIVDPPEFLNITKVSNP